MTDVGARLCGNRVVEPSGIRLCTDGGNHLYGLSALKRLGQRGQAIVDATGHAAVADTGMHGVGKINRSRATREFKNFSFRREDINLIRE